jgi:hypothetical protein
VKIRWIGTPLLECLCVVADVSSYRGITVSEQFSYPGKRRLQSAMATCDLEAAQRRIVLFLQSNE